MWSAIAMATAHAFGMEKARQQLRAYNPSCLPYNQPAPQQATSARCPCCGSRQFVTHASRRICSYCRSEQDGQAVSVQPQRKPRLEDFDFDVEAYTKYRLSVLRPEQCVRIASEP
jgi:hypothetical protein